MDKELIKKAMIAAVTEALGYKEKTKCSDEEAIAYAVKNLDSIIARAAK